MRDGCLRATPLGVASALYSRCIRVERVESRRGLTKGWRQRSHERYRVGRIAG